ncbi:HAD-superhydrolase, subIA, variant 1 family protein [Candidatus Desulfosporosinus infrequens]|uniref:HAD-superhydrolase, subIA, variant 1 family protein n=1 Tax=Candidatus Desulfosporosinus infrequens TaxID=2043169 RepID=A0A2U3K0H8_9FIRM|nr:HAD-superhydrolase, subIA, variant 1 family protein [Candidatus Desulfosporosinus infrequens]
MFKGIIFDLDGTLVDSLGDIANAMNNALQRYGFPTHELQAYKNFIGNGLKNLVRETVPKDFRNEEIIIKCFDSMMEEYRDNCTDKTQPYAGIVELLNELATHQMRLAVLSNKVDFLTKKVVKTLLPNWNFEAVIGVSNEIPRKPNPLGALLISRKLEISPENLIYLGDTGVDMQAANSAGMYAVGALWGFRTKEELTSNGAKYLVNYPLELIQMLEDLK